MPSNACPEIFPNNNPTDYRTRFDKNLDLEGSWEVGVHSIAYSSVINDEKERAEIHIKATVREEKPINDVISFQYVTSDGKWRGFQSDTYPTHIETDYSKLKSVLRSINTVGKKILKSKLPYNRAFVFYFDKRKQRVIYHPFDLSFSLLLTKRLASYLGFRRPTVLSGEFPIVADKEPRTNEGEPLSFADYKVKYMSINIQKRINHVILKSYGEPFDGTKKSFLALWKEKLTTVYGFDIKFKKGKLVIRNPHVDIGMHFSFELANLFCIDKSIISSGSFMAHSEYSAELINFREQYWTVDIFTETLAMTDVERTIPLTVETYPWRFETIEEALRLINVKVTKTLKEKLTIFYKPVEHRFELILTDHCKLMLGRAMTCSFSENLSYLLGFPSTEIRTMESVAVREVDALSNHSRQLCLLSNIIEPTSYGNQQRQILSDFLHKRSTEKMTEKEFEPIFYHKVNRNNIDLIHLQLTDDKYNPVAIHDSNTIVTLYFRKVK